MVECLQRHKKITFKIAGANIRHVEMNRNTFRIICEARGGVLLARETLNLDNNAAEARKANDRLALIARARDTACPSLEVYFEYEYKYRMQLKTAQIASASQRR